MKPIGFALLAVLCSLWMLSIALVIFAVPLWLVGVTLPLKFLLLYSAFRLLRPARHWPTLYRFLALSMQAYPYFKSQRLVFESKAALPTANSSTLFTVFPHGAICIGGTVNLCLSPEFQAAKVSLLGSPLLFRLPLLADVFTWCSIGPVSKKNMIRLMQQGQNMAIFPGGFEEAAVYRRHQYQIFLKERKGFIKYALQFGYEVNPVFTFGEEGTYSALEFAPRLRMSLARKNIPGILFWSKFGWLPDPNNDIITVVGNPIPFPKIDDPSPEDVDRYHDIIVHEVRRLFDKYKAEYARHPDADLHIC